MKEEEYTEFLKKAPEDHLSTKFIDWLRENNSVVYENDSWIIIRNKKYFTEENQWLTAFFKTSLWDKYENEKWGIYNLIELRDNFGDREWLIKAPHKRTVKLFHVHLIKKN